MKIRTKHISIDEALAITPPKHQEPKKPNILFRTVLLAASLPDIMATSFKFKKIRMEKAGKGPYLVLMNHSSFIDLEIASTVFYPQPQCIVCTTDALIGKKWLMRQIGCIPTQKFVSDYTLMQDIRYALKEKKCNVLMFPEAGYSLNGRATPLPRKMGILLKKLDVPVIYVQTYGAFSRDPLYNGLQKRKVKVSADVTCLLTREEIKNSSVSEIDEIIDKAFSFDNFRWQQENGIEIKEKFRADGLERILYKCPNCKSEGQTEGKGIHFTCKACGQRYELNTLGYLVAEDGKTEFDHIPDWFEWQREEVLKEINTGEYLLEDDVKIGILADHKALYMVGEGTLTHTENGFELKGCGGKLNYTQSPLSSYTLNSDYFWYEIGDVIGIGDKDRLYYCFPKNKNMVAKARLAAEELYKIHQSKRRTPRVRTEVKEDGQQ